MTKEEWIKIYHAKDGIWDKDDLIDKAYEIITSPIKTNYDRIKSMSVEEMAAFIERMTEHLEICTRCPAYKMCDTHIKCGENIKQWLLQEVEE